MALEKEAVSSRALVPYCMRVGRGLCERCRRWAHEREVVGVFSLCPSCAGWIRYLREHGGEGWSEEVTDGHR